MRPESIREPARDVPVVAEPDVLVVGGGPAGIAAACAAARAGADTMLVESYGCLGGTLTIVTLGGFCGIHAVVDDERLGRVVGACASNWRIALRRWMPSVHQSATAASWGCPTTPSV